MEVPPNRPFTMYSIVTVNARVADKSVHMLLGFPDGLEDPSALDRHRETSSK